MPEVLLPQVNLTKITITDNDIGINTQLFNPKKFGFIRQWFFPSGWKTIPNPPPINVEQVYLPSIGDAGIRININENEIIAQNKLELPSTAYTVWNTYNADTLIANLIKFDESRITLMAYERSLEEALTVGNWWPKSWLFADNRKEISTKLTAVRTKRSQLEQQYLLYTGIAANYLNKNIDRLELIKSQNILQTIKEKSIISLRQTVVVDPQVQPAINEVEKLITTLEKPETLLARAIHFATEYNLRKAPQDLQDTFSFFSLAIDSLKKNKNPEIQTSLDTFKELILTEGWKKEVRVKLLENLDRPSFTVKFKDLIINDMLVEDPCIVTQQDQFRSIRTQIGISSTLLNKFLKSFFDIDSQKPEKNFENFKTHLTSIQVDLSHKIKPESEVDEILENNYFEKTLDSIAHYLVCNRTILAVINSEYDQRNASKLLFDYLKKFMKKILSALENDNNKPEEIKYYQISFKIYKKIITLMGAWNNQYDERANKAEIRIEERKNQAEKRKEKEEFDENAEKFRQKALHIYTLIKNNQPITTARDELSGLCITSNNIFDKLPKENKLAISFLIRITSDDEFQDLMNAENNKKINVEDNKKINAEGNKKNNAANIKSFVDELNLYLKGSHENIDYASQDLVVSRCEKNLNYYLQNNPSKVSIQDFFFYLGVLHYYRPDLAHEFDEKWTQAIDGNNPNDTHASSSAISKSEKSNKKNNPLKKHHISINQQQDELIEEFENTSLDQRKGTINTVNSDLSMNTVNNKPKLPLYQTLLHKLAQHNSEEVGAATEAFLEKSSYCIRHIVKWTENIKSAVPEKIMPILTELEGLDKNLFILKNALTTDEFQLLNSGISDLLKAIKSWFELLICGGKGWEKIKIENLSVMLLKVPGFDEDILLYKNKILSLLQGYNEEDLIAGFTTEFRSINSNVDSLEKVDNLRAKASLMLNSSYIHIQSNFLTTLKSCVVELLSKFKKVEETSNVLFTWTNNTIEPRTFIEQTIIPIIYHSIISDCSNITKKIISNTVEIKDKLKNMLKGLALIEILRVGQNFKKEVDEIRKVVIPLLKPLKSNAQSQIAPVPSIVTTQQNSQLVPVHQNESPTSSSFHATAVFQPLLVNTFPQQPFSSASPSPSSQSSTLAPDSQVSANPSSQQYGPLPGRKNSNSSTSFNEGSTCVIS